MRRRHAMPFGAEITGRGTRFAIWAPSAEQVTLVLDGVDHPMPDVGEGWRRLTLPAPAGSRYGFRVDGDDAVPDPAARFQPEDVGAPSQVVDPLAYDWQDRGWAGRPWEEAVITELHVGTATPAGTFAGLIERLEPLRDTGFTAIELMPIAEFSGTRSWGYDGVLPFAPDSAYGTPDDLKRLVDRAHALGLMVLLDVVYNHFGPKGNHLSRYASSFFTDRHQTPWGGGINFDGRDGRPVRDFFVHNALFWLEEYRFDGLRFDAVHAIQDDSETWIFAEIAERIRALTPGRQIHLVLENEKNQARWLERDGEGRPSVHNAQWADDIHNSWHPILTGEAEGYYEDFADKPVERLARALSEGFAYQGEPSKHAGGAKRGEPSAHLPPTAFVSFLQNHDQVGNRALGERLSALVPEERLKLARACLLLAPQIPLLFMGEEWSATAPFLFFVDFSDDAELSDAVKEGRRREFQRFAAFADPEAAGHIPDPTDEATFRQSILDPAEAERSPHAEVLADTRRLLALRREVVVPLLKTRFAGSSRRILAPRGFDVAWRFAGGTLRLLANFGDAAVETDAELKGRTVWSSDGSEELPGPLLPAWSGTVLLEPADER